MNKDKIILTQQEVECLIEAYFDGTTTVQQEALLRECLASGRYTGEAVDEACFTMGLMRVALAPRKNKVVHTRWAWWGVAATVAVLITVGIMSLHGNDRCEAWVNGEHITSEQSVENLIKADLLSMGNAATSLDESVEMQLTSLGDALERD